MNLSTLTPATRPLPQNWSTAYTLVVRRTRGLTKKSWHVGENNQGMTFTASFRQLHDGSWWITLTPEEPAGKGLVQQHEHLRSMRRFTPAQVQDNVRVYHRGPAKGGVVGFASRPIVGQDLGRAEKRVVEIVTAKVTAPVEEVTA